MTDEFVSVGDWVLGRANVFVLILPDLSLVETIAWIFHFVKIKFHHPLKWNHKMYNKATLRILQNCSKFQYSNYIQIFLYRLNWSISYFGRSRKWRIGSALNITSQWDSYSSTYLPVLYRHFTLGYAQLYRFLPPWKKIISKGFLIISTLICFIFSINHVFLVGLLVKI